MVPLATTAAVLQLFCEEANMSVSVVLAEQVLNLVNHLGFEGGFGMTMDDRTVHFWNRKAGKKVSHPSWPLMIAMPRSRSNNFANLRPCSRDTPLHAGMPLAWTCKCAGIGFLHLKQHT